MLPMSENTISIVIVVPRKMSQRCRNELLIEKGNIQTNQNRSIIFQTLIMTVLICIDSETVIRFPKLPDLYDALMLSCTHATTHTHATACWHPFTHIHPNARTYKLIHAFYTNYVNQNEGKVFTANDNFTLYGCYIIDTGETHCRPFWL